MCRYIHIFRFFTLLVAMSMIMVIVSVPLMYAMHTHPQKEDRCKNHHHHEDKHDSSDIEECSLCEFYARYIPKGTNPTRPFTFQAPVAPLGTQFGEPKRETPCDGLRDGYTNKGPPSPSSLM